MKSIFVSSNPGVGRVSPLRRRDAERAEGARRCPALSAFSLRAPRLCGEGRFFNQRFGLLLACITLIVSVAAPALAQSADRILKQSVKAMTGCAGEKALRRMTA